MAELKASFAERAPFKRFSTGGSAMRRKLFVSLFLIAAAIFLICRTVNAVAQDHRSENITGTWLFTVTGDAPAPGVPGPVFTELMTFNGVGGLTETNGIFHANSASNPFLPPPIQLNASDGYGTWAVAGRPQIFATTFQKLMFAGPTTAGSLFPGQHIGFAKVRELLNLDSSGKTEMLTGKFELEVTDLAGNVVFASGGTVQGTRVAVEPLAH
jgi:hypothetical protein